jgi:ubiquinone/menaquinone biosynthesis C-methylase UbiE
MAARDSLTGATPTCLVPEDYRRWRASVVGRISDELESALVLELAGDVRGRRVLDVGCGEGELALRLAGLGAQVTGVDASASMIAAARTRAERTGLAVTFCEGRADALPFPAESFDLVVAVTVLCFIEDALPTFREVSRVLAPGGRFVIGELGRYSTWAVQRRLRAWRGDPLWRRAGFRTARELRRTAQSAGLDVKAIRGAIFYPRIALAARAMRGIDPVIGRATTFGAAFIGLAAAKRVRPQGGGMMHG